LPHTFSPKLFKTAQGFPFLVRSQSAAAATKLTKLSLQLKLKLINNPLLL